MIRNAVPAHLIRPVEKARPYHHLADQLRDGILRGAFAEGDRLPSERELVERSGLSRAAVREALRTLSVEGFIVAKLGRFGGNIVTLPGEERIETSVGQFVRGNAVPLGQLREAREALEPVLARLAAVNRSDDDLAKLWQLHDAVVGAAANFRAFSRGNAEWHLGVARASGNVILTAMFQAISHAVEVSNLVGEFDTPQTRAVVIDVHRRITDAIAARDADTAGVLMERHISATHAQSRTPDDVVAPLGEVE